MHAAVLSMSGATMLHHTDARTRPVRSCAVLDPRKSRDDLIYGVLRVRYLSVSSVNSGVTLVPRCARGVSRFSTIIACIDKRDSLAPGSDAGSAAPACATVWQQPDVRWRSAQPRNACGVSSHARSLSTLRGSPHDVSSERAEESRRGLLQYLQWRRGHVSAELRGR